MYEALYSLINLAVMPAWFLLIIFPKATITGKLVHSMFYPLLIGIFYVVCLTLSMVFGHHAEGAGFSSIEAVSALFDHPNGVLTGWSHYLVFDLFVGAWIGRDAIARAMPRLAVGPSQFLTYMFGPVGLMIYLIVRLGLKKGGWCLSEDEVDPA